MSTKQQPRQPVADQRYYSFVVLRKTPDFDIGPFWSSLGALKPLGSAKVGEGRFTRRQIPWHRSLSRTRRSVRPPDASQPHTYDVLSGQFNLGGSSFVAIGFPYAGLARNLVGRLLENRQRKAGEVQRVEVDKLLGLAEQGLRTKTKGLTARMVGVQFRVIGDESLTTVRLGGDSPLTADVYLEYFQPRVQSGAVTPSRCILAFEREAPVTEGVRAANVRSHLYVDEVGAFRFYARAGLENLPLLPDALEELRSMGCLSKSPGNRNPFRADTPR